MAALLFCHQNIDSYNMSDFIAGLSSQVDMMHKFPDSLNIVAFYGSAGSLARRNDRYGM